MSRAQKDVICVDLAGIERLVAFGADIPAGWEYVRDSDATGLAPDAGAPRTIGNVDAAAERAVRIAAEADRAAAGAAAARVQVDGGDQKPYRDRTVEDLEDEVARREAAGRAIEVEGTGSGGNVVKDDLVAALEADDAAGPGDA